MLHNEHLINIGTQDVYVHLKVNDQHLHNAMMQYYTAYTAVCNLISEAVYSHNTVDLNQILTLVKTDADTYTKRQPGVLERAFKAVTNDYANHKSGEGKRTAPHKYTLENIPLLKDDDYTFIFYGEKRYGFKLRLAPRMGVFVNTLQIPAEWLNQPAGYDYATIAPTASLSYTSDIGWLLKYELPVVLNNVVGIDIGTRIFAVTYDGASTKFMHGADTPLQHEMGVYSNLRAKLKSKDTRSARKRLKTLSDRWHKQIDARIHQTVRDILRDAEPNTVFVLERLCKPGNTDVLLSKGDVGKHHSIIFGKLISALSDEATKRGHAVLTVSPDRTSVRCPACGIFKTKNRRQSRHAYLCQCGFRSNDDRVAAMNIRERGIALLTGHLA